MSATFDTSIFVDYFTAASPSLSLGVRKAADACTRSSHPLVRLTTPHSVSQTFAGSALAATPLRALLTLPAAATGAPPLPSTPPGLLAGTLGELLSADAPTTLYVGAKRYPVATVWLEDVHKALPAMPKSEAQQAAAAVQSFDRAALKWAADAQRRGGGGGGFEASDNAPPGGVADALSLPDVQAEGLVLLAARIAVAIAKPGGGDCILVFVPGMAEIEKVIEAFQKVAPGLVAAPPPKPGAAGGAAAAAATGGEDDEEDADLLGLQVRAYHLMGAAML